MNRNQSQTWLTFMNIKRLFNQRYSEIYRERKLMNK